MYPASASTSAPSQTTSTSAASTTRRVVATGLRLVVALLVLPALITLPASLVAPAAADATTFAGAVNAERGTRGFAPLAVVTDLGSVAEQWSRQMAAAHDLSHNPSLSTQVTGWRMLGENVGMGGSELAVHNALMASPGHRANILKPEFSQIGIGIARSSDGYVWVTQVFRQPTGSGQPPTAYLKAAHGPTIYAVTGLTHRAATFAQWAAAGYPTPTPTNTWYVRYPWSGSISAVTFWADGWQWERLDYAAWASAGHPTPRIAGWIGGSTIWMRAGTAPIFITDPSGLTHQLTYAEWEAAEFRAPEVR